jgi:hypothetical protein
VFVVPYISLVSNKLKESSRTVFLNQFYLIKLEVVLVMKSSVVLFLTRQINMDVE